MRHTNTEVCESCNEKLKQSHPAMKAWVLELRARHEDVHVSCSFRNKADQDKAYIERKSLLRWPNSKHNYTRNGQPYSLAVDLFQIDSLGQGHWDKSFFTQINEENEAHQREMRWGGEFKSIGDSCHFEMKNA